MRARKQHPSEKSTLVTTGRYRDLFRHREISVAAASILCTSGPHKGLEHKLDKEILSVGRALWCDLPLPNDPRVSRHHCEIVLTEEGIRLHDLSSHNGTFVGEVPIYEAPLHGSFRVGDSVFALQSQESPRKVDIKHYDASGHLVGQSRPMRKIFSMLSRIAQADVSVLLRGETGVGKSSVARALHEQSARAEGPFVTVNCGALSPSLIEASLFGYEKGAFTGADRRHNGFFEQADGGTLLLDEIGELPLALQPKLLDVLERKCVHRLGGRQEIPTDFRLVCATHTPLEEAVAQKTFREDLYYRLAVAEIDIPPLRQRLDDIPLLAQYILHQLRPEGTPQLSPDAIAHLTGSAWPGNIRQLRNILERSLIFLEGGTLDKQVLLAHTPKGPNAASTSAPTALPEGTLKQLLQAEERRILLQCLQELAWDVPAVIERLGISRASLYQRMQKLGLKRP